MCGQLLLIKRDEREREVDALEASTLYIRYRAQEYVFSILMNREIGGRMSNTFSSSQMTNM
jgi:hypothetical protein